MSMEKLKTINLIFTFCCINFFFTFSQQYPIQLNTIITPPYSARLSDYVESGYDRVQVTINPLDVNLVSYRIKLKLIIESFDGRIRIETDPSYLPSPIYLQGGVPEILTSYDLQPLFDPSHLIFKGISKNEYLIKKKLPENFYRIGFVALDYNRATLGAGNEVAVSNTGFYTAGIFQNDPPILNMPANVVKINVFDPQQIVFQWTPRHRGSPNSAFTTEYVFRLYEVWTDNTNPFIVTQTQMPVYEMVVTGSRYVYGITDPMLIPGRKYVWTVQARDSEQRDMFRNNGMSEAFLFTYGDECKTPSEFTGAPVSGPGMELNWKDSPGQTDYLIQYRIAGSNGNWYEENSSLINKRVYSLNYNTQYETRIKANCNTFSSGFSDIVTIKLPDEPKTRFSCGGEIIIPPLGVTGALPVLGPGVVFYAGGFKCKVVECTGGNGVFSGMCLVEIPFYGYSKVLHTFDNISINSDFQMVSGKLLSVTDEAKNSEFMARIENESQPKGTGIGSNEIAALLGADTTFYAGGKIESIHVNEDGQILVTLKNGDVETYEVEEGTASVVEGSDGQQYFIENGTVTKAGEALANAAGGTGASTKVNNVDSALAMLPVIYFSRSESMKYGFDSMKYEALRSQYLTNNIRDTEYILQHKAVATGEVDVIEALIPGPESFDASGIKFKINETPTTSSQGKENNTRKVNVTSLLKGDEQVLNAVYSVSDSTGREYEKTLGQVNIVAYDKQIIKLHIIPVGSAQTYNKEYISSKINSIYSQAVTRWDIQWHEAFVTDAWNLNGDGKFDDTDKDERMDYTAAMKALIKAYKDENEIEKQSVYVFLFNGDHVSGLSGYMPFNKQFAFIFTKNMGDADVAHNISHEIAHGTFNLRHTFSSENAYTLSQNSTYNLMDYTGPTANELNKYQWDLIHDPESVLFSWLEEEEEGAVVKEGTKVEIKFTKLNDDFEPGKKDLSIEYSITKLEDIAKEHKDVTKAFIWILKDGEAVYTSDLSIKNTNTFKWNGKSNNGETETYIEGLSEFTIKIGVTIEYDYSPENIVEWLFTKDVDFKLTTEKEKNWAVLKWKKDFEELNQKNMQLVSETRYIERRGQYITRLEALGISTAETSPLEYLNEHLVAGDFLGQEIPSINIRFLYFLRKLEEELGRGKKWSQNSATFNNYCALAPFIQDYARMSSVGSSSISDHATGFAFDFDKDKNPYLENGNKYQDKLIQIVTGKKMLNMTYNVFSGNGADEIKKASNDFLERIEGNDFGIGDNNFGELKTVYENVANYSDKVILIKTDKSTEFNNLISEVVSTIGSFVTDNPNILQNELEVQKQSLQDAVETTINFFQLYKTGLDELKILIDASKSGLFINYDMGSNYEQLYSFITDYRAKVNSIITYLENITDLPTGFHIAWDNGINTLKNNLSSISFGSGYQPYLTQFVTKFNEKKNILGTEIKEFPQKLKDETKGRDSYMGGKLFENGFCSLEASLVKAIIQTKVTINNEQMRLMWGGSYNSSKDIMHFELRKQAASTDRPWQKIVHEIDMKDIKDYLNLFKNKNGGDYEY